MDRKSTLVLVVSFLLLMAWYPLMYRVGVIKPPRPSTNTVSQATNAQISPTNEVARDVAAAASSVTNVASSTPEWSKPAQAEEVMTLENTNTRVLFTSHGGGIKFVELKQYPETIPSKRKRGSETNHLASLNEGAPTPALAFLGDSSIVGDGLFSLSRTANGVRAEKVLSNQVRVVKEFQLSSNYLLTATVRLENTSSSPIRIPGFDLVVGTATPLGPRDDGLLMGAQWYNGSRAERVNEPWFANRTLGCLPGTRRTEYIGGHSNVAWVGVHNQFFAMAAIPATNAAEVVIRQVDLPPPTPEELRTNPKAVMRPHGFQAALRYPDTVLAGQQTVDRQIQVFTGPKEYNTLARLGSRLGNNLDLIMEFDGFFGWFAKALLLSMNGLNALGLSYGLSIIAITVIIKLLFWPLTNASTKSMKRMSALQPQMKALQEKYKDDPKKMNTKLMEFMKENKVSPLGGCMPLLLQIPVFFGFYKMLQSAIELRGAAFLWAADLSRPDTVWMIPGLDFPVNPLPLFMGVTMLWQARLTPPSPGMDPVQQSIMRYMPLMFMVFLYNFSAGLTLYWTVQNLLSIAQMKLTKGDNKQKPAPASPASAVSVRPGAPKSKK